MLLYYLEFLELGTGTCEASASSILREGDWDHIRDMMHLFIRIEGAALSNKLMRCLTFGFLNII